jgi:hypothetical protein
MDWNDPAARARLIDQVGPAEYARQQELEFARNVVETVNGRTIRRVFSQRFGTILMVDGTGMGHATIEGAREIARNAR